MKCKCDSKVEVHCVEKGRPMPLGCEVVTDGVNFSIFSRNAEKIWFCLFREDSEEPYFSFLLDPTIHKTGDVWHLEVKGLKPGAQYAWRAEGPWVPEKGHRFDPKINLLDPYAKAIANCSTWGGDPFFKPHTQDRHNGSRLRCLVVDDFFDWGSDTPLNRPLVDTVIYEVHVRGFTCHPSSKVADPGTFSGMVEKIPYLKSLGVTAVELLPIAEFPETANFRVNPVTGEKLKDYWGYNPFAYFAPKAAYASAPGGQVDEFRYLVKEMHRAGIEVILDVVFNHTAEGNEYGPTLSFRGLDNSIYYILGPEGEYHNYSGCGNTLKCNHPLVRDLILDCLRYWVTEMHVDGFRFDLASVLGRGRHGEVLADPPVLERIAEDPFLARTKIIAEAWDAAGLYQVGSFPAWGRWAEWNGKYRDDIRKFIKGDYGMTGAIATRIAGSSDLYEAGGRHPYHSVNFITSHDGFTMWDLVSHNDKHNEANGEDSRDGDNDNNSWNHGVEGPTDDGEILALRKRQIKNFMTILMVSQGVPMIVAGDECLRTQRGNNNAYCQDNELSWFDWDLIKENKDILRFFKEITAFRLLHPVLRRSRYFHGRDNDGDQLPDISWHGTLMGEADWTHHSRALSFLLDGSEACEEEDDDVYVILNSHDGELSFHMPYFKEDYGWRKVVDTARVSPRDVIREDKAPILRSAQIKVHGRSIVVLVSKPINTGR